MGSTNRSSLMKVEVLFQSSLMKVEVLFQSSLMKIVIYICNPYGQMLHGAQDHSNTDRMEIGSGTPPPDYYGVQTNRQDILHQGIRSRYNPIGKICSRETAVRMS